MPDPHDQTNKGIDIVALRKWYERRGPVPEPFDLRAKAREIEESGDAELPEEQREMDEEREERANQERNRRWA